MATGENVTLAYGLLVLYEGAQLEKARVDPSGPSPKAPLSRFKLSIIVPQHSCFQVRIHALV